MSLEDAVIAFEAATPDALNVYDRDGAIYCVLPHGTQLRGRPDEFQGFHVFYRHAPEVDL